MSNLWEVSAVVAMRDLQWLFARGRVFPEAGLNLAGNAESRLGDLAQLIRGRFFLFEIKPEVSKFSSEWKVKKRADGVSRAKYAYTAAMKIATDQAEDPTSEEKRQLLLRSLRCHHFSYWSTDAAGETLNRLCLEPYLRAVLQGSLSSHGLEALSKQVFADFPLAMTLASVSPNQTIKAYAVRKATVTGAFRKRLGIVVRPQGGESSENESVVRDWLPLGLPVKEFQGYVNHLMSQAKDGEEPIHTMAISTGGYCRILRKTKDLAALLQELSAVKVAPAADEGDGFAEMDENSPLRPLMRVDGEVIPVKPFEVSWAGPNFDFPADYGGVGRPSNEPHG
ncbi:MULTISPECIES: hypothetical protein [Xanthomonas]|uniref:hypothetical protein n=1 Tax=Xanthomonas TaxID=338 RepID=UPI000F857D03|nr:MULTISPECIES: hypothetical protein [Xanthomonas]AZR35238.1 hypothetical protein NX08_012950 [Xanthomonas vasicola]WPM78363.1 hypothetical protein XVT_09515 [Xanthomonas citri pv. viticola]